MKKVANKEFRRLFFDIEVSPNIVSSWNVGYKQRISYENIIQERAIICVCWKWEGESEIHSLSWDKGNDKKLVQEFSKVLNSSHEAIGHNSENFDTKWFRTRCLFHGVNMIPDVQSIDTLKMAKYYFRFNSNRLDYIAKFLGVGSKIKTTYDLWTKIVMNNDPTALHEMVRYCKMDVKVLENVFNKLNNYITAKSHIGVFLGKDKRTCPECGGNHAISNGIRITAGGTRKQRMHCQSDGCGKYYSINLKKNEQGV